MSATRISRRVNAPRAIAYRALLDARAVAAWMVPPGMPTATLLLGLALSACGGCGDDDGGNDPFGPGSGSGAINVTVVMADGSLVPGASIYTDPASRTGVTGPLGTARLDGVRPGQYAVYARKSGFSNGSAAVTVVASATANAHIQLYPGAARWRSNP